MRVAPEDSLQPKPRYGWGNFTPDYLQRVNCPKCLLFWMCLAVFGQRFAFSLFPSIITTISTRFNLTTTQIGFVQSFNDVAGLLITVFIAHYAEKGHKGRWLAASYIVCFAAAFLYTVPQWISEPYLPVNEVDANGTSKAAALCSITAAVERNCTLAEQQSTWGTGVLWIFTLAATLAAAGTMPAQIVGTPYIDENVMQSSSALYLAFTFSAGLIASALGLSIGSVFLRIYGDFYRVDPALVTVPPNSPAFYGAWWLGYIVALPIIFLPIIPMFGFSSELPSKQKYRAQDVNQTHSGDDHKFGGEWRDYPRALKVLLKNPVFCLTTLRAAFQLFFVSGVITFLPLYFEQILQFPKQASGMITGILLLVPVIFGSILGSVIVKKCKLTAKSLLKLVTVLSFLGFFPGLGFLLGCPTPGFAGLTRGYSEEMTMNRNESSIFSLNNSCNAECRCNERQYQPVCFEEQRLLYYSPCYAGCTEYNKTSSTYGNCRCVDSCFEQEHPVVLRDGFCALTKTCQRNAYAICFLLALGFFIGGIETQPSLQLGLRTVPFSQRTMAGGLKGVFIKLFGFIPGPVTFGYALDQSCLKHVTGRCGQKGPCAKYSHEKVTQSLLIVYLVISAVCCLLNLLALILYKPPEGESIGQKVKKLGRNEKATPF